MNKFAFYNNNERFAFVNAIRTHVPAALREKLIHFAAALETLPQVGADPQVIQERLQGLQEILEDWASQNNLGNQAPVWIQGIMKSVTPALQTSLKGVQSLESGLEQVQDLPGRGRPVNIVEPPPMAQQQQAFGPDLGADQASPEWIRPPNERPSVLPKAQKVSPGNQSELFRDQTKQPGNMPALSNKPAVRPQKGRKAGIESGEIQRKAAMEPDPIYDSIINSVLEIADMSDEAGLLKEADALASVLPAIRTVKLAQYEGFMNYWIANGRAFEMAYKQKRLKARESNGTDDIGSPSPHEVWFEILDEYQKSLLSNQGDFIAKYAGKEFTSMDRAASKILIAEITSKVDAGESLGVALYESLEQLGQGRHLFVVALAVKKALSNISESANKAGNQKLTEKAASLNKEAQGWFGKIMKGLGLGPKDPTVEYGPKVGEMQRKQTMDALRSLYNKATQATQGGPAPDAYELYKIIAPVYGPLSEIINRARMFRMKGVPPIPDPQSAIEGDTIDPARLASFANQLHATFAFATPETLKHIDNFIYRHFPDGLNMPANYYVEGMEGQGAIGFGQKQQQAPAASAKPAAPAQAPAVKDPIGLAQSFSSGVDALPIDQQYLAYKELYKHIYKWMQKDDAKAIMTKEKFTPFGNAYPPQQAAAAQPAQPAAAKAPAAAPAPAGTATTPPKPVATAPQVTMQPETGMPV